MAHPLPLIPALLALLVTAQAEPEARHQDLIHSDMPLWTSEHEAMWPRAFNDGDTFGCSTRVRYGDWRYVEPGEEDDAHWYRLRNYGVFHCFMLVQDAYAQDGLAGRDSDPSFLISLGLARGPQGTIELWALQRGARPGSEYLLLSRPRSGDLIAEFDVLQRQCPRGQMRRGQQVSILLTHYCAINSRQELTALARRMARRPPLGRLTFVEAIENEADDDEAPASN